MFQVTEHHRKTYEKVLRKFQAMDDDELELLLHISAFGIVEDELERRNQENPAT